MMSLSMLFSLAIRNELIPKGLEQLTDDDKGRWLAIDADNTARMKVILEQYGWPGPELVGRDGSEAASVLVQHADYLLQKEALPLDRYAATYENFVLVSGRTAGAA